MQFRREGILIITLDNGRVLNQQTTQSNRTGCFAIRQMMDNFRGAPFAGNEIGSQRLWRKVFESARHFRVPVFVTSN